MDFLYSACRPFTKSKKRIQKFKETAVDEVLHDTGFKPRIS